jgi:hypothetical protein
MSEKNAPGRFLAALDTCTLHCAKMCPHEAGHISAIHPFLATAAPMRNPRTRAFAAHAANGMCSAWLARWPMR